ncbi:spore coat protein YsxE [Bacillus massiliglaciei]|uniref:spore coat protein YsxE n=1 Tax=Bacillus massiliglaciei TaxID=1816693 RepID=UPI001F438D0A|nr:spore coat protein YsxE [Bacillus massiliglaciei]
MKTGRRESADRESSLFLVSSFSTGEDGWFHAESEWVLLQEDMNQAGHQQQEALAALRHYALKVHYIEDFGKVKKVYTDRGVFALKRIPPNAGMDFIRNVQKIYQRGYNRIVPIYPTGDGRYAVLENTRLYYLMPWLTNDPYNERDERHKQMFRELARMHGLTVKEMAVDPEEREDHYNRTVKEWEEEQQMIDELIVSCERKWYMSPYEMMFCLYYTDISQALKYSLKQFESWFEKAKEQEKVRAVVTHGKVSLKHFVYDDRGYGHFLNFENSKVAPPHFDLLPFLVTSARTYPIHCDDCVEWLYNYLRFFPLKEEEMLLMQSYFAYPGAALGSVRRFVEQRDKKSELEYVQDLQKQYWLLKNVEYMAMKMEEREKMKKEAAAQQTPPD